MLRSLVTASLLATSLVAQRPVPDNSKNDPQKQYGQMAKESYGQPLDAGLPTLTPEVYRLEFMRQLVSSGVPVAGYSTQIHRMGDEAGTAMTKILGRGTEISAVQENRIVSILEIAFEKPVAILADSNRTPTTTLLLLERMESWVSDPERRDRIATARERIIQSANSRLK